MATKTCTRYPTMSGEPHLGYMTECEITATLEEVLDCLIDTCIGEGEIPSMVTLMDQNDEDIEVEVYTFTRPKSGGMSFISDYMTLTEHDKIDNILAKCGVEIEEDEAKKLIEAILKENLTSKQLKTVLDF